MLWLVIIGIGVAYYFDYRRSPNYFKESIPNIVKIILLSIAVVVILGKLLSL